MPYPWSTAVASMRAAFKPFATVALPAIRPVLPAFGIISAFLLVETLIRATGPFVWGHLVDALVQRDARNTILLFALLLTVGLTPHLIMYFRDHYEIDHIDWAVAIRVMVDALKRISGLSMSQVADSHTGKMQDIVVKGRDSLERLIKTLFYRIGYTTLQLLLSVIALLWTHTIVGIVAATGALAYLALSVYLFAKHRGAIKMIERKRSGNQGTFREVVAHMPLVMANARETTTTAEFSQECGSVEEVYRDFWHKAIKWYYARNVFAYLIRFGSLVVAVVFLFRNDYSFGTLLAMNSWLLTVTEATEQLGQMQKEVTEYWARLSLYIDLLSQESDVVTAPDALQPSQLLGTIEFRNVEFRYDPRKANNSDDEEFECQTLDTTSGTTALQNVSFTIRAGEKVALVGESGAGKSTVATAIIRSRDPHEGTILLDNTDLRLLDPASVRRRIGYVAQKPEIFDNTLRYNLLFSLNGEAATVSDDELLSVLATVRLGHLAENGGLEKKLGENGHTLSGGEQQRLCIARTLLKKPDVLIFDEATSALDPVNEKKVQDAIDSVRGGTQLIIAHRYSTIKSADRILVFERGRLIADGTHSELFASCEYYRQLLEQQGLLR